MELEKQRRDAEEEREQALLEQRRRREHEVSVRHALRKKGIMWGKFPNREGGLTSGLTLSHSIVFSVFSNPGGQTMATKFW